MEQSLTSKQQFWCSHILAAQHSQVSYAEYAKQHSLNLKALYYWSMTLRRKGLLDQSASDFMEVKLEQTPSTRNSQNPSSAHVRLANGVELELLGLNEQTLKWLASL